MLKLEKVNKIYNGRNGQIHALCDIDLDVATGEFITVLGPSGCGKSTLLHLLGGFESHTSGTMTLGGEPILGAGRDRGMVFQHATLFPWRTIEGNVAWPLEANGQRRKQARLAARELLDLVGLAGFNDSYPNELSGGMRQRAAIARTLALSPKMLLMDEPFGALDSQTRELMQEELNRIWEQAKLTVVFITHDINEAVFLGDRVVVLSSRPGRVISDVPITLERPRNDDTKRDPAFLEYHHKFWSLIREQIVMPAGGTGKSGGTGKPGNTDQPGSTDSAGNTGQPGSTGK